MPKTVTIRLTDEEYQQIVAFAKSERRTISNFLIHAAFLGINSLPKPATMPFKSPEMPLTAPLTLQPIISTPKEPLA